MSTTAHGHDDLQLIAMRELGCAILAPWHDLAVALHGNAPVGEFQLDEQRGERDGSGKIVVEAVDAKGDHFVTSAKSSSMRARYSTAVSAARV